MNTNMMNLGVRRGMRWLGVAVAALTLAACSETADVQQQVETQVADEAIGFDAYLNRSTTRAYYSASNNQLTLDGLKKTETTDKYGDYGFGVFAYYTGKSKYSQTALPQFMYNQQVKYQDTKWKYSPLKYWPNGYGEAEGNKGNIPVYTSFFAYAPYSPCDPYATSFDENNMTNKCITACTETDETGYPYVRYRMADDPVNDQVDLCYADVSQPSATGGLLDQQKQTVDGNLQFNFKHALAGLKVTIDSRVNQTSASSPNTASVTADSRIYFRSITFDGFATEGTLNLNSTTKPTWYSYAGTGTVSKQPVVLNDCRRDGREAVTEDAGEQTVVKSCLLNPDIIQKDGLFTQGGVDATVRNLFTNASTDFPLFVIPNGDPLTVTITYDVETQDANLITGFLADGTTHGSSIENTITKTIKLNNSDLKLEAGKTYTVALHLGMTSVEFEAEVSENWVSEAAVDGNLPSNGDGSNNSGDQGSNNSGNQGSSNSYTAEPVQLWENGPYFADRNLGATSEEDYGLYFAWGETSTKESYTWDNYKWMIDYDPYDENGTITKYSNDVSDSEIYCITLQAGDDAAYQMSGGDWRMPTKAEMEALIANTQQAPAMIGTVKGIKFMEIGNPDNYIFLPAAGGWDGDSLDDLGEYGTYWTSSLNDYLTYSYSAYILKIYYSEEPSEAYAAAGDDETDHELRYRGFPIRPVRNINPRIEESEP